MSINLNEKLYDGASEAIRKLFHDTSVDVEQTKENLEALMDEIQDLLDTLPEDIQS